MTLSSVVDGEPRRRNRCAPSFITMPSWLIASPPAGIAVGAAVLPSPVSAIAARWLVIAGAGGGRRCDRIPDRPPRCAGVSRVVRRGRGELFGQLIGLALGGIAGRAGAQLAGARWR